MKTHDTNFHHVTEILATAFRWPGRKPLWPRGLPVHWAAALLLPAFAARADVVFTNLYSFTGADDGASPQAALVQASDGYLYGTTFEGGANGVGTVFKVSTSGAFTHLYSFDSVQGTNGSPLDGSGPNGLVQGSDGYFYGTTQSGGAYTHQFGEGYGTVFRIGTNGVLTSLYSFGSTQDTNGNSLDGTTPYAGLVQGTDGYFYGTTLQGGTNGWGTVFKISTNGALTTLYSFTGGKSGASPQTALVQGTDGYFYGTTANFIHAGQLLVPGTVFRISTNGALTALASLWDNANGLVQGSDGYFYGTTTGVGGTFGWGTVFKISTNGTLSTLYSFTGGSDGADPYAALIQGSDGNFYGTTSTLGPSGYGTFFRLTIVPEFIALTLTNGTLALTWSTEAGGIYQLQASASLNTPNWINLGSPVTATNGTLTFTDAVTNAPQRFYRVSLAQ